MNEYELLKTFIKLVEFANDKDADCLVVCVHAPDGGKLKCKFEFENIVPEDNND